MNIYSIIGFVLALIVMAGGVLLSTDKVELFVDPVSAFVVVGGTIAAVSISFPLTQVAKLFKVFFIRVIKGGKSVDYGKTIKQIVQVSEKYRKGAKPAELIDQTDLHFLKEALQLLSDDILDAETMYDVLSDRIENMRMMYSKDNSKFKAMGKYPPAFGMMGTTIGMVVLLSNLGGKDAMKTIGPAMGVCLLTTLYGVVVANMLIVPVGENLDESTAEMYLQSQIILEGFSLMLDKPSPVILVEKLNSFLLPSDRVSWKELVES